MPKPPVLRTGQRWWPDAMRKGILIRQTMIDGRWLTDREAAVYLDIPVKTFQRRAQRDKPLHY